jgi:hypothetical protein
MATHCWICGGPPDSREHAFKRSDIKDYFGTVTIGEPLYKSPKTKVSDRIISPETKVSDPIISPKSQKLQSEAPMCRHCNNERTQPYDYAWQTLSRYLQSHWAQIVTKGYFSLLEVFPSHTRLHALHVHLYFVKALGCRIIEDKVPLNIGGFSEALLSGNPHKNVFLTFANMPPLGEVPVEEVPDDKLGVSSAVATGNYYCGLDLSHTAGWVYGFYPMCVRVSYLSADSPRTWRLKAWHPCTYTPRVNIGSFFV